MASVLVGDTLWFSGDFHNVGPATGGLAITNPASGDIASGFPAVVGRVFAIASDGAGGWYIGGAFTSVGGQPRADLAHVLADMSVAPWNPGADAAVHALAVSGGTVYVGGEFITLGGASRAYVGAVNAGTGAATSWNPGADGSLTALTVSGTSVFVGGYFSNIGGKARTYLAELRTSSNSATNWAPNPDNIVLALAVSGSTLYVGGGFQIIKGMSRSNLAAINLGTGNPTTWNPGPDNVVNAIAVSGATVYVGGLFSTLGGATRHYLGAVDAGSGTATAWLPEPDSQVDGLAAGAGAVYAAGWFSTIGGQPRRFAAALDPVTGTATGWDARIQGRATTILVDGSSAVLGGWFIMANVVARGGSAAIDVTTKAITSWDPGGGGAIAVLVAEGSRIYAGGSFTSIGGAPHSCLAAFDRATGAVTSWDPAIQGSPGYPPYAPEVVALTTHGDAIYAGGRFEVHTSANKWNLAGFDATTALPSHYTAYLGAGPAYRVNVLANDGARVYYGQARDYYNLGSFPADGSSGAWNVGPWGSVDAMCINGGMLSVGGAFTGIGNQARSHIASFSPDGVMQPWDPGADDRVLAFASGFNLYVGGQFATIAGQPRSGLAAFDPGSGVLTSFHPLIDRPVLSVAARGNVVYACGEFTMVGSRYTPGIAAIADPYVLGVFDPPATTGTISLAPSVPYPMRESARIRFSLAKAASASLAIYDLAGRQVRLLVDRALPAGPQEIALERDGLPGGLYFMRLESGGMSARRKLVILP